MAPFSDDAFFMIPFKNIKLVDVDDDKFNVENQEHNKIINSIIKKLRIELDHQIVNFN